MNVSYKEQNEFAKTIHKKYGNYFFYDTAGKQTGTYQSNLVLVDPFAVVDRKNLAQK